MSKKTNLELDVMCLLLLSDSKVDICLYNDQFISPLIVGIGFNLAIEVLKDGVNKEIIFAYNQFIIVTLKGFALTMFLNILKFMAIEFYGDFCSNLLVTF
ncbi:MAG: hypothetical protein ACLUBD_04280 [Veillonella parvula]|uniref:hypothetical protein n=1 Tax=Veillonella parvula TaxID=29466 RepID=UPI0039942DD2